jgi:hypothetical protein
MSSLLRLLLCIKKLLCNSLEVYLRFFTVKHLYFAILYGDFKPYRKYVQKSAILFVFKVTEQKKNIWSLGWKLIVSSKARHF